MTEDNNLQSAYEADLAYRQEKVKSTENELQASKSYIAILTKELEESKEQIESIKRTLYSNEKEIEEIKLKSKRKLVWIAIAILEAILLIVLAIAFFESKDSELPADTKTNDVSGPVTDENVEPVIETYKYVENLEDKVSRIKAESIAPFKASVVKKYDMEYLCFSYGSLKLLYRNEFHNDETGVVQRIQLDNGKKLVELNRKYDLAGDLTLLCPKVGKYLDNNKEQALFITCQDNQIIPEKMEFIDIESLWDYEPLYINDEMNKYVNINYSESIEGIEDMTTEVEAGSGYMSLTVNEVTYNYAINQAEYTNAVYNGESLLNIADASTFDISENNISFVSVFMISENRYLGELSAKVILENGRLGLSEVKYGAYVPANQEDVELCGIIKPYKEYIVDRVTIGGLNKERFIIQKSKLAKPCSYNWELLDVTDSNDWKYKDEAGNTVSIKGIDVSKYQGSVNWSKVRDAGVEFAIIRLGYRGMNQGTLEMDPYYKSNIKGATDAGVKAGIYFFSQAVNEKEAKEEAEYVLKNIKDYDVQYPVVFDTERITTGEARANNLSRQERTDICIAFCEEIKAAGYTPMIYANTKYMIMGIDLEQLGDYDKWFAYYGNNLIFPYDFSILQYSESGSIPGISGAVDLNISFVDYSK